ncbi:hypothetical protein CHL79_25225 [Delftia acidovorans]|uniref:hypothetical protein n=1 Tax=Delftia acidovorans TaxID=80866 RepID=UPI000BC2DF18|nr:hypothetical protein [Delftia acidovorans]ATH15489.1 hypothetical protein CHL79_25225 [Delftia acidovorans]
MAEQRNAPKGKLIVAGLVAAALVVLAGPGLAQQKTPADLAAENEVQLQLLQQQRQIRDMLGTDPIVGSLPTVVSVIILDGKKTARLALANGAVLTFSEGDEIAERMTLASVAPRKVQVRIEPLPNAKSKKPVSMTLAFKAGGSPAGSSAPGTSWPSQGAAAGMPAAPLAMPAGLVQAQPALPSPGSAIWNGPMPNQMPTQAGQPPAQSNP